jgi:beta-lactam-binding protein with PASTA domain
MPNLVGENLQDAQDKLQALDSFFLQQNDATGMERFQVIDSNWKVCTQKPSAGQKVPVEKMVVLEAVKLDETCP